MLWLSKERPFLCLLSITDRSSVSSISEEITTRWIKSWVVSPSLENDAVKILDDPLIIFFQSWFVSRYIQSSPLLEALLTVPEKERLTLYPAFFPVRTTPCCFSASVIALSSVTCSKVISGIAFDEIIIEYVVIVYDWFFSFLGYVY